MSLALMLAAGAASTTDVPICTDRPAKANAVCTVPKGRLQLETSLANWSLTKAGETKTRTLSLGSSFLKYGLTDRSDLQIGFTPWVRVTGGTSGLGDIVIRFKQRLTGDDAPVQFALIPFVKLPTAPRGIGNRRTEGGLAGAISTSVGAATVTLGPELDLLADSDGHGTHLALINLVNVSGPIAPRLTIGGELWTNRNFDPAGTVKQASADASIAYALSTTAQLDAGTNLGLTKETADVELYAGFSLRF